MTRVYSQISKYIEKEGADDNAMICTFYGTVYENP